MTIHSTEHPVEEKERTVRFTVDLPESMHTEFSVLAAKCKQSKAALVKLAIAQMLKYEQGSVLGYPALPKSPHGHLIDTSHRRNP